MKYHIDTIPVWDAYKADCECPMCLIRRKCELDFIDSFLGGSVMEPDTRIEVNAKGFCQEHLHQLYAQKNRLGLALMTHTNMLEANEVAQEGFAKIEAALNGAPSGKKLFRPSKTDEKTAQTIAQVAQTIRARTQSCIICQRLDSLMDRYFYTLMYMYEHEAEFRKAFAQSKGMCRPHLADALEYAVKHLKPDLAKAFITELLAAQRENDKRIADELYAFTTMFDYRNQGKSFGNARDALPRAINRVRGLTFPEDKKE